MQWNDTAWQRHRREAIVFASWISLVAVVGVVGNSLILARFPRGKTVVGFLVRVLAAADLFNCLLIPYTVLFELSLVQDVVACKLLEFCRSFGVAMATFQLMVIAVEKYFVICRPLTMLSRKTFVRATGAVLLFSLASNTPNLFLAKTEAEVYGAWNRKYFDMGLTTCHVDTSVSPASYAQVVLGMLSFWGAVVVMIVCYGLAVRALNQRGRLPKQTQPGLSDADDTLHQSAPMRSHGGGALSRQAVRSLKAFLVVTIFFGIAWAPFWILRLGVFEYNPNINYTFFVNNACNFFVYIALLPGFRRGVRPTSLCWISIYLGLKIYLSHSIIIRCVTYLLDVIVNCLWLHGDMCAHVAFCNVQSFREKV